VLLLLSCLPLLGWDYSLWYQWASLGHPQGRKDVLQATQKKRTPRSPFSCPPAVEVA